jgi:hypothetical protein
MPMAQVPRGAVKRSTRWHLDSAKRREHLRDLAVSGAVISDSNLQCPVWLTSGCHITEIVGSAPERLGESAIYRGAQGKKKPRATKFNGNSADTMPHSSGA